jgi:hypothetical protein
MEGEAFIPPAERIVRKIVERRERQPIRLSRTDPETALALSHIAAMMAGQGGVGHPTLYQIQHPGTSNEQVDQ